MRGDARSRTRAFILVVPTRWATLVRLVMKTQGEYDVNTICCGRLRQQNPASPIRTGTVGLKLGEDMGRQSQPNQELGRSKCSQNRRGIQHATYPRGCCQRTKGNLCPGFCQRAGAQECQCSQRRSTYLRISLVCQLYSCQLQTGFSATETMLIFLQHTIFSRFVGRSTSFPILNLRPVT